MFGSNGEPLFDDPKFVDTSVKKIPIGMKMRSIFYELPYWEQLNIFHVLDPIHIVKKCFNFLMEAHIIEKNDTTIVMRDLISSNTKKRHWPRKTSRGEASRSWYFKEGDVSWILKKDCLSMAKDVILGVKAPSLHGSTL